MECIFQGDISSGQSAAWLVSLMVRTAVVLGLSWNIHIAYPRILLKICELEKCKTKPVCFSLCLLTLVSSSCYTSEISVQTGLLSTSFLLGESKLLVFCFTHLCWVKTVLSCLFNMQIDVYMHMHFLWREI